MPQVDFYLLLSSDPNQRLAFACKLIEKIHYLGHPIYVHVPDGVTAHKFDTMLWTFRDISFVPHDLASNTTDAPILIGFQQNPPSHNDALINLSQEIPPFFNDFKRIVEIVPNDEDWKKQSRKNYAFYKKQDLTIETHNLASTSKSVGG